MAGIPAAPMGVSDPWSLLRHQLLMGNQLSKNCVLGTAFWSVETETGTETERWRCPHVSRLESDVHTAGTERRAQASCGAWRQEGEP